MGDIKNLLIDNLNNMDKQIEKHAKSIEMATECGLIFTGEFEDEVGTPIFMGTEAQWSLFTKVRDGESMYKELIK